MNKCHCWSTSRFNSWSIIVFDLYKWSLWRTYLELFADDALLFSVIDDRQISVNDLHKDLEWCTTGFFDVKWISIQTLLYKFIKSSLFVKQKQLLHPCLVFNSAKVTQLIYQKHLGIILDSNLTFENHLQMVTTKLK